MTNTRWRQRLETTWRRLRFSRRRVWVGHDRTYVEVHPAAGRPDAFRAALETELAEVPDVAWARLNLALGRSVVAIPADLVDTEHLVDVVDRIERRFGVEARAAWRTRHPFPADRERLLRLGVELASDATAFTAGLAMRVAGTKTVPAQIDLAALVSVIEGVPPLRDRIEGLVGPETTDLALNLASAVSQALVQGAAGPVVDAVSRILRIREYLAQSSVWKQVEARIGATPEAHEAAAPSEGRPTPMRRGPIEHYTSRAVGAALGAFGFSFVSSHNLMSSTVPLFGGIPKPARLGRRAFAAHLGRRLARRGAVVMDAGALRVLDRIDAVLVPADVLRPAGARVDSVYTLGGFDERDARRNALRLLDPEHLDEVQTDPKWRLGPIDALPRPHDAEIDRLGAELLVPGGSVLALEHHEEVVALLVLHPMPDPVVEAFASTVRDAGLLLVAAGRHEGGRGWVEPERVVAGDELIVESIRTLQTDGHAVCFVGSGPPEALVAADVGLCLLEEQDEGATPPWGASMIARNGLSDAAFVVEAIRAATNNSRHSVYLSLIDAVSGLILTVGGLKPRTVRRVMAATNVASMLAMANGARMSRSIREHLAALRRDPTPWHALDVDTVLDRLGTSRDGLSPAEAEARRPPQEALPSAVSRFSQIVVEELANPLAPVLAAGAGLSALTGAVIDAAMIGAVVGVNAFVGAVQRYRTDKALAALDTGDRGTVRGRRGGRVVEIDRAELAVGDVILLESGELVPADARVSAASGLELDESSLTGESLPVPKSEAPSFAAALADRTSMVFEGTTIAAGRCEGIVTAVGEQTESRRAIGLRRQAPPSGVEVRLESLTELTAPLAALSGVALMTSGLTLDRPAQEVVSSGVSLAVAAVPEGLPLLATVAQLAAARRLSARGALVRNTRAVEALGRADVLCADKTGTLTEGRIRLVRVSDGDRDEALEEVPDSLRAVLRAALRATPTGRGETLPHATDRALVEGAHSVGLHRHADEAGFEPVWELPFESARGFHAALGRIGEAHHVSVKGSPEQVLPRCAERSLDGQRRALDDEERATLVENAMALARRGLRVLAVADRSIEPRDHIRDRHVVDLTFRGFLAFADPVRATAKQAVDAMLRSGVGVMMITGDHPSTAEAIAVELGLPMEDGVITGPDLDQLDDDALDDRIAKTSVFARVTPTQKVRIVQALQRAGRVVAMTGDGANDAPAIRLADVGIALGERSTPAARRAADIVVTDGRIETIVDAVLEGRALWRSVRDAVGLLVGGNLGEIGFTLAGGLAQGRSPLNARQLLLVNLLTDTLPALAVAVRKPPHVTPEQLLSEGPEASLGSALNRNIGWRAVVTGLATTGAWVSARVLGSRERADTVALLTLVGCQLGQTLAVGRGDRSVLATGLGSLAALVGVVEIPGLSHFFGSRPLGPVGLTQAAVASTAATVVGALGPRLATWTRSDRMRRMLRRG